MGTAGPRGGLWGCGGSPGEPRAVLPPCSEQCLACSDPGTFPFYGAERGRGRVLPDTPIPILAGSTWIPTSPHPSLSAPGALCDTWGLGSTSRCHQMGVTHTLCHPTMGFVPWYPPNRTPAGVTLQEFLFSVEEEGLEGLGREGMGQRCSPSSREVTSTCMAWGH